MMNLTDLEKQILTAIPNDDFYEAGLESVIWADVFIDNCGIEWKIARGVLSSLVKKEIIYPIVKGRNGTIAFTEKGKEVMKSLGLA